MENDNFLDHQLIMDLNDIYDDFFVKHAFDQYEAYNRIQTAIQLHKIEVESQKQFDGVVLTDLADRCIVFTLDRPQEKPHGKHW